MRVGRPTTTERVVVLLVRWLMLSLAVWVAAGAVAGIHLDGWGSTLAVAAILGLLNVYLRPVLFFFSLPLTILTLGLFLIVINAMLLGLTSWIAGFIDELRFSVDGIWPALLGALIISIVGAVLRLFVKPEVIARDLAGW
jgi:putative membrane protein